MKAISVPGAKVDAETRASSGLTSAVKSAVLLFLIFFPLSFLHLVTHEGGHALVNLIHRVPSTIVYIHPFSFAGYVRPVLDWSDPWLHIAGPMAGVLAPLLVFIPLWKHRSTANLFVLLLFPWNTFWEGLAVFDILGHSGDLYNVVRFTGLPATLFIIICIMLMIIGVFFTISLFPLLGLKPENLNALWVIPAGTFLWALPGLGIAHWIVQGSPIDVQYGLAPAIIQSANYRLPMMLAIGIVLALVFVTLYRVTCRKLPASLRTETKSLAWQDLRWPAAWSAVSVVTGLILVR